MALYLYSNFYPARVRRTPIRKLGQIGCIRVPGKIKHGTIYLRRPVVILWEDRVSSPPREVPGAEDRQDRPSKRSLT
jgi:hypothetical protein